MSIKLSATVMNLGLCICSTELCNVCVLCIYTAILLMCFKFYLFIWVIVLHFTCYVLWQKFNNMISLINFNRFWLFIEYILYFFHFRIFMTWPVVSVCILLERGSDFITPRHVRNITNSSVEFWLSNCKLSCASSSKLKLVRYCTVDQDLLKIYFSLSWVCITRRIRHVLHVIYSESHEASWQFSGSA